MFDVEVRPAGKKGRGVFAARDFKKGEVVEKCPLILLTTEECALCEKTLLDCYIYAWNKEFGAILLGYGFIYNHSYAPNAIYVRDYKNKLMVYKSIRPIKKGEEVTVNYNGSPRSKEKIDWLDLQRKTKRLQ